MITWVPPADNGVSISSYSIRWSKDGGSTWQFDPGPYQSPYYFVAPLDGNDYQIEVAAVGGLGQSPWSAPSNTFSESRDGPLVPIPVTYYGGAVITSPPKIYEVWLGDWNDAQGRARIVDTFARGMGQSPYLSTLAQYSDGDGRSVASSYTVEGSFALPGAEQLSGPQGVAALLASSFSSNSVPLDPNAIYLVLGSTDVTVSGFLTAWCGFHGYLSESGDDVPFMYVGDPTGSQLSNCAMRTSQTPNGDAGADAMVSVVAHEVFETFTDPTFTGWHQYQDLGLSLTEIGDKCAWRSTLPSGIDSVLLEGFFANATWTYDGNRYFYYLQTEWALETPLGGQGCLAGGLPSAPISIGASFDQVTRAVTVQWQEPEDIGSCPPNQVDVEVSLDGGNTWDDMNYPITSSAGLQETSVQLGPAWWGLTMEFRLRLANAEGWGTFSSSTQPITIPAWPD
jgi:hypothetical protein